MTTANNLFATSSDHDIPNFKYDYTQYSHDRDVNVIPEDDFKHLVSDTFATITDTLRSTYGPYGSSVIITESNQTTTTKDGYNVFTAMRFSHQYKHMVYLAIKDICQRVNDNVGDGTTSCILLAEKMFNQICSVIHTQDDKRNILKVLTNIERGLQDPDRMSLDKDMGQVKRLDAKTFMNIIRLAANYDEGLAENLYEAMQPEFSDDEACNLMSMRNVVVKESVDSDNRTDVQYEYNYLPGDYRVAVRMDVADARRLVGPEDIKIALFDHAFQKVDWEMLTKEHNGEEKILVLARAINGEFENNDYRKYRYIEEDMKKKEAKIILAKVDGLFIQNEIQDLGAVLGVKPFSLDTRSIDLNELPVVNIQIADGDCLCINNCKPPEEYIDKLRSEMYRDGKKSYTKKKEYEDRIRALSLQQKDTILKVKTGSHLEAKIIKDKLQDCTSIIASAAKYGVVPNMLHYAHDRICDLQAYGGSPLMLSVVESMLKSIEGLFHDIWISKYGSYYDSNATNDTGEILSKTLEETPCGKMANDFYYKTTNDCSFDIIENEIVDMEHLPTSAQYDLEVVVAAVSIVKYLLTSRAFIFDSCLLKPHGDRGIPSMM